jgi:hypothetical protein
MLELLDRRCLRLLQGTGTASALHLVAPVDPPSSLDVFASRDIDLVLKVRIPE